MKPTSLNIFVIKTHSTAERVDISSIKVHNLESGNMETRLKIIIYRFFLILSILEGFSALLLITRIPIIEQTTHAAGLSTSRLLVLGFLILSLLFLSYITLRSVVSTRWLENRITRFEEIYLPADKFLPLLTSLSFISLTGILLTLLFSSPLTKHMLNLTTISRQIDNVFIWALLVCIQALVILLLFYWNVVRTPGFMRWQPIARDLVIGATLVLTFFQWSILITRDALLTSIPGWYWQFQPKEFQAANLLILPLILAALGLVYLILKYAKNIRVAILFTMLLGYLLQIGFGFIDGGGFESIRQKFISSGHRYYALHAGYETNMLYSLTSYETTSGHNFILGTKPPGGLLIFSLAQKVTNLVEPAKSFSKRFLNLTSMAAVVFPFLAVLVLWVGPLYFRDFLTRKEEMIIPGLLLIFCANFILMPLQFDQFLYPALFGLGFWLVLLTTRRQSTWLAFITGLYLYAILYFSFSLIPLLMLAGLWVTLDFWLNRKERTWRSTFKIYLGIIAGFLFMAALLYYFLNYDIFLRYNNAFAWHRRLKLFQPGLGQVLNSVLVNNLEFAFWSGIPLAILFILRVIMTIRAFFKRKGVLSDWLVILFLIMYLFLNVAGQTRSEVGRLWLFLLPMVTLMVTPMIEYVFKNVRKGLYFIIILQMVTTFLIYLNMDFY